MVSTTFWVNAPPIVLTPMIVVGLMLSMAATKSLVGCMRVRIGQLEVDEVLAGRFEQAVDVEHIDTRDSRLLERHALRHKRRTQQVGKADARRSRAEEQDTSRP